MDMPIPSKKYYLGSYLWIAKKIGNKTTLIIRYEKPKNNQTQNIKLEKDYLIDNILCVETLHEIPKDNI